MDGAMKKIELALGGEAMSRLARADLLRTVDVPAIVLSEDHLIGRRLAGGVLGLALGDALVEWMRSTRRRVVAPQAIEQWLNTDGLDAESVTAATQLFVQSAEAWPHHGWAAPTVAARDLVARAGGLRDPGNAVRSTVRRLERGRPWFQAAPNSYGDAALPRAVAVGLAMRGEPTAAPLAGSLDAVLTHRSKSAALCGATLAGVVAALAIRPQRADWRPWVANVVASVDHQPTRELLEAALVASATPPVGEWMGDVRPHADETLAVALWAAHADDPVGAIVRATFASDGNRSAVATAAALAGLIHGAEGLPARTESVEGFDALQVLAARLSGGGPITADHPKPDEPATTLELVGADIWFLLDRSGSMQPIARDVVAGFDEFFAEQRLVSGDATVTVVQFDGEDPHDVLVDGLSIRQVASIGDRFEPRGMTPLYDAIARLLDRAERHGGVPDDQLVVIFTDGRENASTDWTRERIFDRIQTLQDEGWTFVFLGANQDSYDTGDGLAMAAGNVSNFRTDEASVRASYRGLSRTVGEYRGKNRRARRRDQDNFWGGVKEGEEA